MTKAEEAALKAYPKEIIVAYGPLPGADGPCEFDNNLPYRIGYQEGYEQAEKDLALTIDDVERLHTFLYAAKNNKHGVFTFTRLSDEQYEEVLRRFQESKAK